MFLRILFAAALLGITTTTTVAGEPEEGFQSMFNGKDLTGWEGKPGWWRVEDGAITAESTKEKPCRKCNYLLWRGGRPGNFEMRLQYKIIGGNSGIQFRSREVGDFDTNGYQADLEAGDTWSGALFQHGRGGVALRGNKVTIDADGTRHEEKFAASADLQEKIKKHDWNDYRIVADGSRVLLEINGVRMAEVTDNDAEKACQKGVIGLQVHPGPPMKVQFRNLRIKLLD
jgi:hypothetical protein